jgi:predicted ATPase
MLMVLDNFEQILEHATATISLWLKRAPGVRFLVTSRALLGIAGEKEYELFPLPTPGWELDPTALDAVAGFAGVQLFVERAKEAKASFQLDAGNAPAVVQIVKELDGMPLAIELAAARARIMKPSQIAKKLGQKFSLLQSTRRDLQARQKTLTGAIEWSFDLLEPWEKEAYLQACCFRDGFTLEAAEMVLDLSEFDDAPLAMDVAQGLREKSLLTARDTGYETRLGMYRAIREFGQRKWDKEADEEKRAELRQRHAEFFLGFAEEWNELIPGPRDQEAMDRIADEIGNFGAVQAWARESGDAETAANATLAVAETMKVRRPPRQLIPLVEGALEALGDEENDERVRLLTYLSIACYLSGDWDRAQATADEAVALGYELNSDRPLGLALRQQGEVRRNRGDLTGAMESFLNSELIAIGNGDRAALAVAIGDRGMVLGQEGDMEGALECFTEAEQAAREVGDHQTVALHVSNRGVVCERRGDLQQAVACQREAEDIARRLGDRLWAAACLGKRANALVQGGDHDGGLKCYREAEAIARELGAKQRIAHIVGNRGSVHVMRDELDEALKCYEEAEAIARELGEQRQMALMLGQRASIIARAGQPEAAEKYYARAEEICRGIGDRRLEARYRCSRGGLMREAGRLDDAWEALRDGIAIYDDIGDRSTIYFALKAQLAAVARERGDEDEAKRIAAEGLALAETLSLTDEHPNPAIREGLATLREIEGRDVFFEG